jgi:division protein 1
LELVQKAFMSPFNHKKSDSTRIFSDRTYIQLSNLVFKSPSFTVAPVIMTPRMMNSAATFSSRTHGSLGGSTHSSAKMSFATLGRAPLRLGLGSKRITSGDLQIFEAAEDLLHADVPEPEGVALNVSLLKGFSATIPSSEQGKFRRRQMRNVETPRLRLRKLGMNARGLLSEDDEHDEQSVASEEDVVIIGQPHNRPKKKGRESLSASKRLGKDELMRQRQEILIDKENIHVRKVHRFPSHLITQLTL